MASPLLAMIGSITLAVFFIAALVAITVIAVQAGLALAQFIRKQFRF